MAGSPGIVLKYKDLLIFIFERVSNSESVWGAPSEPVDFAAIFIRFFMMM